MQKVQLYIEGERLDLFKDEVISITQSLKNIKDLSKIFTEFTQSFNVPASKINNKIFQHYYNFNIINGFDARSKKAASIELNYFPFKDGYIRLDGVDLKKNKAYSYKITFFGKTVNLKDLLGDDQLDSLDLSAEDTDYNDTTVISKMNVDVDATNLVVPLITHSSLLHYNSLLDVDESNNLHYDASVNQGVLWTELKYALRIDTIIQAIQLKYNLVFSDNFFNNTNEVYYNLFIWLHRKSGNVIPATQNITDYSFAVNDWLVDPVVGSNLTMSNGTSLIITEENVTPPNLIGRFKLHITNTDTTNPYRVTINRNGQDWYNSGNIIGNQILDILLSAELISSGNYNFIFSSFTDAHEFDVELELLNTVGDPLSGGTIYGNAWSSTFLLDSDDANFRFSINQQIPEIKIIDFLSGLFNMFNLVAYYYNNVIIIQTYDEYFDFLNTGYWNLTDEEWQDELNKWNEIGTGSGRVYPIDKYIDVEESQVNVGLPYKQINFNFQGTRSFLANQYNQLNNIKWGELRYTLDNRLYDAPNEVYNIRVPFEHMMYERLVNKGSKINTNVQYGYCVNENQQPYIGSPLLFYPIRQSQLNYISVRSSTSHQGLTSIIVPSNSVSLYSGVSTNNINFQLEFNEFQLDDAFTNTLFEAYYKTLISESFKTKRRLTIVKAFLPLKIIYDLKLNDLLQIYDQNYKINSITTNLTTGESKIELLNIV